MTIKSSINHGFEHDIKYNDLPFIAIFLYPCELSPFSSHLIPVRAGHRDKALEVRVVEGNLAHASICHLQCDRQIRQRVMSWRCFMDSKGVVSWRFVLFHGVLMVLFHENEWGFSGDLMMFHGVVSWRFNGQWIGVGKGWSRGDAAQMKKRVCGLVLKWYGHEHTQNPYQIKMVHSLNYHNIYRYKYVYIYIYISTKSSC